MFKNIFLQIRRAIESNLLCVCYCWFSNRNTFFTFMSNSFDSVKVTFITTFQTSLFLLTEDKNRYYILLKIHNILIISTELDAITLTKYPFGRNDDCLSTLLSPQHLSITIKKVIFSHRYKIKVNIDQGKVILQQLNIIHNVIFVCMCHVELFVTT